MKMRGHSQGGTCLSWQGVRNLERALAAVCRNVALQLVNHDAGEVRPRFLLRLALVNLNHSRHRDIHHTFRLSNINGCLSQTHSI